MHEDAQRTLWSRINLQTQYDFLTWQLISTLIDSYKVRQADPTHNDAKMKLAEIYEILGEPWQALELV